MQDDLPANSHTSSSPLQNAADMRFVLDAMYEEGLTESDIETLLADEEETLALLRSPRLYERCREAHAELCISDSFYYFIMANHAFEKADIDEALFVRSVGRALEHMAQLHREGGRRICATESPFFPISIFIKTIDEPDGLKVHVRAHLSQYRLDMTGFLYLE